MKHTIIIPHRDRQLTLGLCLWSIARSAEFCDTDDYEVIVVDNGSTRAVPSGTNVRLLRDYEYLRYFNKCKLLNMGIEAARGDVITFLDADALVGTHWMGNPDALLLDPSITRLCYRVRCLGPADAERLAREADRAALADAWFAAYNIHKLAHEGYGKPEHNGPMPGGTFGNSQFSMLRETLGDLRYDEAYEGAGFEDLEFIRRVYRTFGYNYKGVVVDDPLRAMFHFWSNRESDWGVPALLQQNMKRYFST